MTSPLERERDKQTHCRTRFAQKQSLVPLKGIFKSSLSACNRTFTQMALLLIMVLCILGGWFNIKLPERKSTIGTSSNLPLFDPLSTIRFLDYWVLSNLQEFAATIIRNREGLCSCMNKRISLNNNKQLIRHTKVLQNTVTCEETFCINSRAFQRDRGASHHQPFP